MEKYIHNELTATIHQYIIIIILDEPLDKEIKKRTNRPKRNKRKTLEKQITK